MAMIRWPADAEPAGNNEKEADGDEKAANDEDLEWAQDMGRKIWRARGASRVGEVREEHGGARRGARLANM
jgi:hypothetical protein